MLDYFKALSDETRLRILSLVLAGELCVCQIEECLKLTQSNASRHLTVLKNAGILSSAKHAQWAYYRLNEDFVSKNKELYEYLGVNLKKLPSYETDIERMKQFKFEDICNDTKTVQE